MNSNLFFPFDFLNFSWYLNVRNKYVWPIIGNAVNLISCLRWGDYVVYQWTQDTFETGVVGSGTTRVTSTVLGGRAWPSALLGGLWRWWAGVIDWVFSDLCPQGCLCDETLIKQPHTQAYTHTCIHRGTHTHVHTHHTHRDTGADTCTHAHTHRGTHTHTQKHTRHTYTRTVTHIKIQR